MILVTTEEHEIAVQGIARTLGITPDEVAAALIEAGILWLTAKELRRPMDQLDLEQWPGTAKISRVLGAAYRQTSGPVLWKPN